MIKLTFLSVLLAAAIASPVQAQSRNVDWVGITGDSAAGIDLNSIVQKEGNVVRYDYWMVVNQSITQVSQYGACDGSGYIVNFWIRKWEGSRLISDQKVNTPIREAVAGSFDDLFLTTACNAR